MAVVVSMLRGVNVGGHNKIKMDALRALCESLKLCDAQTYVQSGNVVFRTDERDLARLAVRLQDGIERKFGFRPGIVLRNSSELRDAIARNPFARRRGIEPSKLLVWFLASHPGAGGARKSFSLRSSPKNCGSMGASFTFIFRIAWRGRIFRGRCWNGRLERLGLGAIGIALRSFLKWRKRWKRRSDSRNPTIASAGGFETRPYGCHRTDRHESQDAMVRGAFDVR
jgi:uncharacterized protein DUF1697